MVNLTDRVGKLEGRMEGMQRELDAMRGEVQSVGKKVASLLERFAWMRTRLEEQERERKNEERREDQQRERKGKQSEENLPVGSSLTGEATSEVGNRHKEAGGECDVYGRSDGRGRRLEMPVIEEDDPDGWEFWAERYFSVNQLSDAKKLDSAAFGFGGAALAWFRREQRRRRVRSWGKLKATGKELGVAVNGLAVEEKMDTAALCMEGAAFSWVQWKQRRRRVRSWEELKGLLRNSLGSMREGAVENRTSCILKGNWRLSKAWCREAEWLPTMMVLGSSKGKAGGQPTIDPFKRPRMTDPVTAKESISLRKGAPSTVHVVWEDGLTLRQVSQKFYSGMVDNGGPPMYSHHHEGVGASSKQVMMVEGQYVWLNLHSVVEPNDTKVSLVVGDITKESTLVPEYFKGVKKIINAASVIIGPKEGDTPNREKYSQGIKFFEPEVKGDSPEKVEFIGMKNLINAVKESVGLRSGKLIYGFEGNSSRDLAWGALDDVVMGGVSESTIQFDPTGGENGGPTGVFKGVVLTANNGGFTSIRTRNFSAPENLSAYDGLELRVKGDGRRYKLIVRTSRDWDTVGYTSGFDTLEGQWQSVRVPFTSLRPIFRARTVADAPPFEPSNIISLQLMFSKFEYDGKLNPTFKEGAFQLPVSSIRAYINEPVTPRFVHVGSAGVTRPDRPGLDLSKQPPAVRLNKELGFVLTFKLKGEDLIRESGIPYTIVRPCALTEEPAGADLIFDQGDNITGKISREEVARICVAALESPYACDKTFEVKSAIPFSETYTVDPENPPPEKDYSIYFKTLKDGITGKEILEQSPVPV